MGILHPLFDSPFEASNDNTTPPTNTNDENLASEAFSCILSSKSIEDVTGFINNTISIARWHNGAGTGAGIARLLLQLLEIAIEAGVQMEAVAADALKKATEAAVGFPKQNSIYTAILALGVLAISAPFLFRTLGFTPLGPANGSFAAWFESWYGWHLPGRFLATFFRRLEIAGWDECEDFRAIVNVNAWGL